MRNPFTSEIGVDIGTSQTLISLKKQGIVLRQPSVVAMYERNKSIVAAGHEALELGANADYEMIYPIREGVIANTGAAIYMMRKFIARALRTSPRLRFIKAMLCTPSQLTNAELQLFESVLYDAGVRSITLIQKPLACAMGAKLPIERPEGFMVVDIGAGTSEVGVLSLNGVVVSNTFRCGGAHMDQAIASYIRRTHNIVITPHTSELLKLNIGTAIPNKRHATMHIRGREIYSGQIVGMEISSDEIYPALRPYLDGVQRVIRNTLEDTPPELAGDLIKNGILLAGGSAQLAHLPELINLATQLPVQVVSSPDDCVAQGYATAIDSLYRLPSYGRVKNVKQLQSA